MGPYDQIDRELKQLALMLFLGFLMGVMAVTMILSLIPYTLCK